MIQPAVERLERDGEVEISTDAIGFRSALCGAILLTIPGVVRRGGTPPRIGWHEERPLAAPSRADRGAIRPWWVGRPDEYFWMEITDRSDIGADLHCPQRDTADRANSGYSTILFVQDGDLVVHYDRNAQAVTAWSVARGPVEAGPTRWASHRGAVRRRVGTELREQPGWWLNLEGPFLIAPVPLADLRARGSEVLASSAGVAPIGTPVYAPFYGYGAAEELRPTQYYLTKLPRAVAGMLRSPSLSTASSVLASPSSIGTVWREPWVSETEEKWRFVEVDVEVVERGLRGHVETERAVGEVLRTLGLEPSSAPREGPNFDVAWESEGDIYVAEIKSTTDRNEERQLRLGLGQVLRYKFLISARTTRRVHAVLVPERTPRDDTWRATCAQAGVHLVPREELAARLPLVLQMRRP